MSKSSSNPFRNPSPLNGNPSSPAASISPNVTGIFNSKQDGASNVNSESPSASNNASAAATRTSPPAVPPISTASTAGTSSSNAMNSANEMGSSETTINRTASSRRVDPVDLPEEDPPAYTPGPDVHHGEATVEYGPSRPFQPPPSRPPQSQGPPQSQQHPGWTTVQNHVRPHPHAQPPSLLQQITGNLVDRLNNMSVGGSSYNYNRYEGHHGQSAGSQQPPGGWRPPPGPPPGQVQAQNTGPPASPAQYQPPSHPPPSSDFARDFYEAGTGPGSLAQSDHRDNPAASTASSSPTTYAPPVGPPQSQGNQPAQQENDGRPTTTPIPGHPLLNKGNLLVFPKGYACRKCNNTGYKHADPSHPCKRCWRKYAKPFNGALMYSNFSSDASGGSGSTFQKPLPIRKPPHHSPPPPPPGPGPSNGYPGSAAHHQRPPPLPPRPSFAPMGYGPPPPQHPQMVFAGPGYTPYPPGANLVRPGDPRIGGRLCYRCGGDGLVDMLFWEERCGVCGGTGRVF
ncbi:hypothetical protein AAF712_007155 [Marasmius tenuissimus]|uniref:Uncharacterized protein n=1 Tax=Marasmius tenuissimus TaxID=585030 RepID=A0ABR2ZVZ6_9AGAR